MPNAMLPFSIDFSNDIIVRCIPVILPILGCVSAQFGQGVRDRGWVKEMPNSYKRQILGTLWYDYIY